MSKNKLKLVYDVSIIKNGGSFSARRSGLFFVTLNVLKELIKREDVALTLTCNGSDFACIEQVLALENLEAKLEFEINRKFLLPYGRLKLLKKMASANKNYVKKIFLLLLQLIVFPVCKLASSFEKKKTFENFDADFSPVFIIPQEVQTKKYTLLYDLIPQLLPEFRSSSWKKGFWLYDLCQTLNHNDNYFTISEHTRKDFLKYYPEIDPKKITTTLLACDDHFKPNDFHSIEAVKKKYEIPLDKKYVFSLCTLEPRKNLERAVRTFVQFLEKNDINDMVFVLGGGHWKSFIEKLKRSINNLGEYKDKIIKAGYIADEDLPALYSGAEWFCYTSAYEGFGLPPLEAMSCGCPVITSNNSSLPEVVGNAGIMIDWDSDEQHIEAYEKYYFNPQPRKTNREKGLARAKEFSWEKCVDEMITTMKRDIGKGNL
ncbi:MAG: glycosyltransferase family 4 protein [Alphaproteobacteria bacterium]|nr:glycosyltransferase family 4 protein [Alphaproteobacteria bacterium]